MYTHTHTHIYIYIYIGFLERWKDVSLLRLTHKHAHTHSLYIYIYICVCVCVCVCVCFYLSLSCYLSTCMYFSEVCASLPTVLRNSMQDILIFTHGFKYCLISLWTSLRYGSFYILFVHRFFFCFVSSFLYFTRFQSGIFWDLIRVIKFSLEFHTRESRENTRGHAKQSLR